MAVRISVQLKIALGFALFVAISAAMAGIVYVLMRDVEAEVATLVATQEYRGKVTAIGSGMHDLRADFDQSLAFREQIFSDRVFDALALVKQKQGELAALLSDGPLRSEVAELGVRFEELSREVITLIRERDTLGEAAMTERVRAANNLLTEIDDAYDRMAINADTASNRAIATSNTAIAAIFSRFGIGILTLIVLGIGSTVLIATAITRPIKALTHAAARLAEKDYSSRAPILTHDEIGTLAGTFNLMADRLSHYTQDLENEVVSRTQKLIVQQEELRQANEKLLALDRAKSQFLSVASHQLRTPLAAITWVFGVLGDELDPLSAEERRSYVLRGAESTRRMTALVSDLLTVSDIESGRTEYRVSSVALETIVNEIAADFRNVAAERMLTLHVENSAGAMPFQGDADQLGFVFRNLIENAVFYTEKGGHVTVRLGAEAATYVISVIDTGIGIPEDEQMRLFTKFSRGAKATGMQTDGNGIGLFAARAVVDHYGGTITYASRVGEGSTFTVTLPKTPKPLSA